MRALASSHGQNGMSSRKFCRQQPIPKKIGRKRPKDSQNLWLISRRIPWQEATLCSIRVCRQRILQVPFRTSHQKEDFFEQTSQVNAFSESGSTSKKGTPKRKRSTEV